MTSVGFSAPVVKIGSSACANRMALSNSISVRVVSSPWWVLLKVRQRLEPWQQAYAGP